MELLSHASGTSNIAHAIVFLSWLIHNYLLVLLYLLYKASTSWVFHPCIKFHSFDMFSAVVVHLYALLDLSEILLTFGLRHINVLVAFGWTHAI